MWKPQPVIIDEDEFCFSQRGRPRSARTFHVLGSYGYTVQGRPVRGLRGGGAHKLMRLLKHSQRSVDPWDAIRAELRRRA